jgi:hypothetical protein
MFVMSLAMALVVTGLASLRETSGQGTTPCQVSYRIVNQWTSTPPNTTPAGGGFQAEVQITNNGAVVMNGWNVSWSFANGQNIYQLWDGSLVQTGTNESVTNLSYNATISPATSRTFGFLATWSNHYIVMGGSVLGGRFYGTYPPVQVGLTEFDFPLFSVSGNYRGAFVPTFSMDQYGATLARWFGLSDASALDAFPNLANFNVRNIGFLP